MIRNVVLTPKTYISRGLALKFKRAQIMHTRARPTKRARAFYVVCLRQNPMIFMFLESAQHFSSFETILGKIGDIF